MDEPTKLPLRTMLEAAYTQGFRDAMSEYVPIGQCERIPDYEAAMALRLPVEIVGLQHWSVRVGARKAGRTLDGKIWDEFPKASAA